MQYKGFFKLVIQITVLSLSMLVISLLTETQFYSEWFTWTHDVGKRKCNFDPVTHTGEARHWNYRGYIYFLTGLSYVVVSIVKIVISHKKSDFKNP